MRKHGLHVVIYSEILEYGGGRETWLEYFLQGLVCEDFFSEIWIHHLHPRSVLDSLSTKIKQVHFNELELGYPENNNTLSNMIRFTRFIAASLKKYANNDDVVLFVGTGMEAVSALTVRLLWGRNIKILVWVRSIIAGELMSRGSSMASYLVSHIEKKAFGVADRIIFNGKDTREYYDSKYADVSNKFTTIENAVKYGDFAALDVPDFSIIPYGIGYIGRFCREKGFDNLIDAVNILEKGESQTSAIKIQAWGHGIAFDTIPSSLVIHGSVARDKIPTVLQSCHVVLFLNKSAKHEAGGLSHGLLEAMAAGRLIIAWDNVIHKQVLNDNSAILIPEGDIKQLAYMFTKLHNMDKTVLVDRCNNARAIAQQYTVETHINKFMQLISEL